MEEIVRHDEDHHHEGSCSDGDRYDDAVESPSSESPLEIIELHDHDVLSGRGKGVGSHPGNHYFRQVIRKYKQAYTESPRSQKMAVANQAISEIESLNPPGRFLDRLDDGTYVKISGRRILEKTSQALREKSYGSHSSSSSSAEGGPLSSSASPADAVVDPAGLLQDAIIDAMQQQARLLPYYADRIVPTFVREDPLHRGAYAYLPPARQQQQESRPSIVNPSLDSIQQFASHCDSGNAMSGLATSHDDMIVPDQFCDADETIFNTSLAVFHYCVRSGYL